jgi:hypothetical protein
MFSIPSSNAFKTLATVALLQGCAYAVPEPAERHATEAPETETGSSTVAGDSKSEVIDPSVSATQMLPRIGPSPEVAAQRIKSARGVIEIAKGSKLPGWRGQLVVREQADGQAEVQISLAASDEAANEAVLIGYKFHARDSADLIRQIGQPIPILPVKQPDAAGVFARIQGVEYQGTSGILSEVTYSGGRLAGHFASALAPRALGTARKVEGKFSGELDFLCWVLPRAGDPTTNGRVRSNTGARHRLLSDFSSPFCQRFL